MQIQKNSSFLFFLLSIILHIKSVSTLCCTITKIFSDFHLFFCEPPFLLSFWYKRPHLIPELLHWSPFLHPYHPTFKNIRFLWYLGWIWDEYSKMGWIRSHHFCAQDCSIVSHLIQSKSHGPYNDLSAGLFMLALRGSLFPPSNLSHIACR